MALVDYEPAAEVRAHRRSFIAFERLVLFAILHITLTLACLALAFLGQVPLFAVLLGVGGTIALIVAFVVMGTQAEL
jgi:hypothetical protein